MRPNLSGARAAILSVVMLLVGAAGAQATVTAVDITGGATLTVIGSAGDDAPKFTYYPPGGPGSPGYTRIFDNGGVLGSLPTGCSRTDIDPIVQPEAKVMVCEDGGTATTFLTNLVLVLGDGNDAPVFEECFDVVDLDLGEGATNSV